MENMTNSHTILVGKPKGTLVRPMNRWEDYRPIKLFLMLYAICDISLHKKPETCRP
jgi:hypothetical protein